MHCTGGGITWSQQWTFSKQLYWRICVCMHSCMYILICWRLNKIKNNDAWQCGYLAILVVDPQVHAGRHEQQQRLLLTQFFPQPVDHFGTLVSSLKWQLVTLKPSRFSADLKKMVCADKYLLFLDFTADMWYLDLQGIQLFIWYLWNSQWLQLLRTLEG